MTVLIWTSTNIPVDISAEDSLISKSPYLERIHPVPPSMAKMNLDRLDLTQEFRQHVHVRVNGVEFMKHILHICSVVATGNDQTLREIELSYDSEKDSLAITGGTPTTIYKIYMPTTDIILGDGVAPFSFKLNMTYEEIEAFFRFIRFEMNAVSVSLGVLKPTEGIHCDRALFAVESQEVNKSVTSTNPMKERVAIARVTASSIGDTVIAESISNYHITNHSNPSEGLVTYTSEISPRCRIAFNTAGDHVEFVANSGRLAIKSYNDVLKLTTQSFVGTEILVASADPEYKKLPEDSIPFAATNGVDMYKALSIQKEPLKCIVAMNIEDSDSGTLLRSSYVALTNEALEIYLAQSMAVTLPEATAFTTRIKKKMELTTLEASLEQSLKDEGLKKREREEAIADILQEPPQATEGATDTAPEVATEVAPEGPPEVVPERATEVVPEGPPEVAPEVATEVAPEVATEVAPEGPPEVVPERATEVVPEGSPESSPDGSLESSPDGSPEGSPESSPKVLLNSMESMASHILMLEREVVTLSKTVQKLSATLAGMVGMRATESRLKATMVDLRGLPKAIALRKVAEYVDKCRGAEVRVAVLAGIFTNITSTNISKYLTEMVELGQLTRERRGVYRVHEDFNVDMIAPPLPESLGDPSDAPSGTEPAEENLEGGVE